MPVYLKPEIQSLGIGDLIGRNQPRAERGKSVAALSFVPLPAALELICPLADVVAHAITNYVIQSLLDLEVLARFADYDAEFHFPIRLLGAQRDLDLVIGANDSAAGLQKQRGLRGDRHAGLGRMVSVIQADTDNLAHVADACTEAGRIFNLRKSVRVNLTQRVDRGGQQD